MKKFKPEINKKNVKKLLKKIFNQSVEEFKEAESGKIKRVFFFKLKGNPYVIRFSDNNIEFKIEKFIQDNINDKQFPIPETYYQGEYYDMFYSITEMISGTPLYQISKEEFLKTLPDLMNFMAKFHAIDISSTTGFGWPDNELNGCFESYKEYIEENFSNDISGFWYGWHELFDNTFLDSAIFNDLYDIMMALVPYCEGRRYLAHTDFHYDHILVNDSKVTGIIDWGRVRYVDFLFDIVTIVMQFPSLYLIPEFKNYYMKNNLNIDNFHERFICAAICQSLDGMRFWAKMGAEKSYTSILNNILSLLKKNFNITI